MTNITAKMAHSKESVELMCITQYNTFEFGKKVALYVVAIALVVFGIVGKVSTSISLVCIMIGCFMLTGSNAVAKSRADAVIKLLGGQGLQQVCGVDRFLELFRSADIKVLSRHSLEITADTEPGVYVFPWPELLYSKEAQTE